MDSHFIDAVNTSAPLANARQAGRPAGWMHDEARIAKRAAGGFAGVVAVVVGIVALKCSKSAHGRALAGFVPDTTSGGKSRAEVNKMSGFNVTQRLCL